MQAVISVGGRFHAFYLAKELDKRNYLKTIFTSYPYFAVKNEGIPKGKIVCLPIKEILERFIEMMPGSQSYSTVQYYGSLMFDKQVSRLIKDCDVLFAWAGFSLFTIRQVHRNYKTKILLERSSSHIGFQREILEEESRLIGMRIDLPEQKLIDRELKEYEESDYILIPSQFVRQTFIDKGFNPERLIQVHYGIDQKAFRAAPKEDKIFRIIYVGVCLRKGIHYLLEAVRELKLKNFEIWLIGKINEDARPIIERYKEHFKYIGGIPHNELFRYYSQGSVFVLPSLEEGLSLSMLEAMACGLPVIITEHTGGKDIITDGKEGFIIPIRDVNALKEKILYLYDNPKICKQMGDRAREKIESSCTWDQYGNNIINCLEKIIDD